MDSFSKKGYTPINENKDLMKAEFDVSREYHIPLFDIKKLVRA